MNILKKKNFNCDDCARRQLISECLLGVIVFDQKSNEISALASKKRLNLNFIIPNMLDDP